MQSCDIKFLKYMYSKVLINVLTFYEYFQSTRVLVWVLMAVWRKYSSTSTEYSKSTSWVRVHLSTSTFGPISEPESFWIITCTWIKTCFNQYDGFCSFTHRRRPRSPQKCYQFFLYHQDPSIKFTCSLFIMFWIFLFKEKKKNRQKVIYKPTLPKA